MNVKFLHIFSSMFVLVFTYTGAQNELNEIIKSKISKPELHTTIVGNQFIHSKKIFFDFYKNRLYKPIWDKALLKNSFLKELEDADKEGLNSNDYHLKTILELYENRNRTIYQEAELDLLLTDAFLLYASHLFTGKVDQEKISPKWKISTNEGDPVSVLEQAILKNSMNSSLENIKPKHNIYKGLKNALQKYNDFKNEGGWQQIPDGILIKPNIEDSRIPLIRKRLVATKDLPKRFLKNSNIYDEDLIAAVKQFQLRHGLDTNSEIDKKTLLAMNLSVEERIDQIKVNLERWRWLSQKFGNYYFKVNIADFTMEVIKDGERERLHKIVVGRSYRKTPVFSSKINHLVFNPTWTVPPGILNADILPSVRKNVNYLKTKNLVLYDNNGKIINPNSVNFTGSLAKSYKYVQPPGPDNALGAVKFMFPNKYNVYLHDTPSKELFEKSERAFSSGCIRVQNPLELAEYMLSDKEIWNLTKINNIVNTRKTQTVSLKIQPEIHILYWTAWTDDNGIVQFRNDIYERDFKLLKALQAPAPTTK